MLGTIEAGRVSDHLPGGEFNQFIVIQGSTTSNWLANIRKDWDLTTRFSNYCRISPPTVTPKFLLLLSALAVELAGSALNRGYFQP